MSKELTPDILHYLSHPTAPRFSFLDRGLLRQDSTHREEDGLREVRTISYSSESARTREIRDKVAERGLLLGHQEEAAPNYPFEVFVIPVSARPFVHDRSIRTADSLGYSDDQMFHDLGCLLRGLADVSDHKPYKLTGDLGSNIAMVEFTKPEEPKMLLVPGFENKLDTAPDHSVLLDDYAVRINEEFGEHFIRSADSFIRGFSE